MNPSYYVTIESVEDDMARWFSLGGTPVGNRTSAYTTQAPLDSPWLTFYPVDTSNMSDSNGNFLMNANMALQSQMADYSFVQVDNDLAYSCLASSSASTTLSDFESRQLRATGCRDVSTDQSIVNRPSEADNILEQVFVCSICSRTRTRGFNTTNDLDRHRKSVHKIYKNGERFWQCGVPGCRSPNKVWPRLDNFTVHVVNVHGPDLKAMIKSFSHIYKSDGTHEHGESSSILHYRRRRNDQAKPA